MNISAFVRHDANFSEKKELRVQFRSTICHTVSLASNSWKLAEFFWSSQFLLLRKEESRNYFSHSGRSGVFWRLPLNHLPPRPLDFYALQEKASADTKYLMIHIDHHQKMPWQYTEESVNKWTWNMIGEKRSHFCDGTIVTSLFLHFHVSRVDLSINEWVKCFGDFDICFGS